MLRAIRNIHVPVLDGPAAPFAQALPQLAQVQHQLANGQHRLAQAVGQLAQAVHRAARAGSIEAAQRATDSHQLLVDSGIALGIVAALALGVGWLLAGRMLRPIRTITRKAQRRFVANASHELRAPLTRRRALIQVALADPEVSFSSLLVAGRPRARTRIRAAPGADDRRAVDTDAWSSRA
jgi:signal transduction histidine kinase